MRILFVCHGNICRSPMAEFIMKDIVAKAGRADRYEIESAATSSEELGNPVYPPAKRMLARHGISCPLRGAVRVQREDYAKYDLLICMDERNMVNLQRILGADPEHKVLKLMDLTQRPRDVADTWYTGNFDETYEDLIEGCNALFKKLEREDAGKGEA